MRILFVDDEPNVRQGLERLLRKHRHEWEMSFAAGGREALELLAAEPYDVVVSDVRMPGIDGVQLLREVQVRHPDAIRVILSGHVEPGSLLRAVGPAHQYLSKPCDAEALVATIRRATGLRRHLHHGPISKLVARMNSLPSPPATYREIMAELQSDEPSIRKVAEIVSRDVAMSAKVLQIVNSAFFGLSHRITDTARAVMHLGLDTVRALALSTEVFSQVDERLQGLVDIDELLAHSAQVAALGKRIARAEEAPPDVADACFQAGFLHDIGELILAANLPDEYGRLLERADAEGRPAAHLERDVFGASHAEMGGYLLGIWGLPDSVVEAVMFHHRASDHPIGGFSPLLAVHVADHLHAEARREGSRRPLDGLDEDLLAREGFADRLEEWRRIAHEMLREDAES